MAVPSRERQLVDGVWRYRTVEEAGGGGSVPDLAQVLTAGGDAGDLPVSNVATIVVGTEDSGEPNTYIAPDEIRMVSPADDATRIRLEPAVGIVVKPPAGATAFEVEPDDDPVIALNCGGLPIMNVGEDPFGSGEAAARIDSLPAMAAYIGTPEVPASPTEQDIVDALVSLGLVTQAAP